MESAPVDLDGCSPDQLDTDEDGVNDKEDSCPHTVTGSFVDSNGCALDQKDSDSDGIADAHDAFPDDPEESKDTDGDGVADGADFFPNDATMYRADQAEDLTWLIYVLLFVIGACGVGMFLMRSKSARVDDHLDQASEALFQKALPAESLQEMAEVTQEVEAEQWTDDDGVHWARQPDGSVMFFDVSANEWRYQ